ncbi:E3 UFM1-protein ligase 1 [Sorochytrium milnesiophthora]
MTLSQQTLLKLLATLQERELLTAAFQLTRDGNSIVTPRFVHDAVLSTLQKQQGSSLAFVKLCKLTTNVQAGQRSKSCRMPRMWLMGAWKKQLRPSTRFRWKLSDAKEYISGKQQQMLNELQHRGTASVHQLRKSIALTAELCERVLDASFLADNNIYFDSVDTDVLVSATHLPHVEAAVLQELATATAPVLLSSTLKRLELPVGTAQDAVERLVRDGRLPGKSNGTVYTPDVHAETLREWALAQIAQDGYLEYDVLKTKGIMDGKPWLASELQESSLQFGDVIAYTDVFVELLLAQVSESVSSTTFHWLDMQGVLSEWLPRCSDKDITTLTNTVVSRCSQQKSARQIVLLADVYLADAHLSEIALAKLASRVDQACDAQSRRIKQRPKSKAVTKQSEHLVDLDEAKQWLADEMLMPAPLSEVVATQILPQINRRAYEKLTAVFIDTPTSPSSPELPATTSDLGKGVGAMFVLFKEYVRGLDVIKDDSLRSSLAKHLLSHRGSRLVAAIRDAITTLPASASQTLSKEELEQSLTILESMTKGKNVSVFVQAIATICQHVDIQQLSDQEAASVIESARAEAQANASKAVKAKDQWLAGLKALLTAALLQQQDRLLSFSDRHIGRILAVDDGALVASDFAAVFRLAQDALEQNDVKILPGFLLNLKEILSGQ